MSDWTYTTLLSKIAGTLNKTNLTAVIPDFVTLGEATLFRRLKVRNEHRSATIELDVGSESYPVPAGLEAVLALSLTSPARRVEYVTPDSFDALRLSAGPPRFYTIMGSQFLFAPIPDQTYEAKLRTRERLCPLNAQTRTNWLLCQHPDAYLYATLMESAPYLRDDERLPMWAARLDQIIQEINETQPRPGTRLRMDELTALPRSRGYDIERG
jgi:hypothetical protein